MSPEHVTRFAAGLIFPDPSQSRRKRFAARHGNTKKFFPTRRAARIWLGDRQTAHLYEQSCLAIGYAAQQPAGKIREYAEAMMDATQFLIEANQIKKEARAA